ncbi:DEAD/DEAH box helicase [Paracoccus fistulariae]|uniref:DEAD/DEAH box helicase n=1 Tax=Paracoccus fistulariae TaxID=658446 RepID=A0ABY7SFM3_9RHOB|nr:DEAD/DEAH box helicase [Paracoccus fistulariae]MDB6181896.1 DEAD/DEAH box helicase [Paracoccus fistulariae]WCR05819.1 DEAD/DEAH box helicase [Paracoccus fistulariae]
MTKFSDLKLDPKVLKAIAEAGYDSPTPIQAGAIPPALEGRDVLGIAQTGTGKTASFTLPTITLLGRGRARARMPRSLVLCPTRELAAQVAENFDVYAKYTKLTKALLIGGVSFAEQDKLIDRGVDVLIATPGRLLDHFERGKLLLTGVQIMVVDEADRMLDMGFIPDIERIFQLTPFTRQTLFFSATMAPEIERITNTFLHTPERIEVARQATTSETITQRLVELTPTRRDQTAKQKRDLMRALIDAEGEALTNAIIFCNRKTDVDIVAKSLKKHGYDAAPIHGDLDQSHRTRTLESFRDGKLRFLVASDVAARGLDIPAVSHVFNFDLPGHAEDYVHRIGRTGRAGRLGTAISIATPADEKLLSAIENLVKQTLPRAPLPEGFSLSESDRPQRGGREDRKGRDGREGRDKRRRGRRDDEQGKDNSVDNQGDNTRDDRPEPRKRSEDRKDRRDDNRRDRRQRGRNDDRGPVIVGMGDHVPEFMLVELRPSMPEGATEVDQQDDQARKPAETEEKPASKRSRSRRRSARQDKAEPATVEETASTTEAAPAAEEQTAAAPQPEAQPADTPEAPAAIGEYPEPPATPKRARRKKAEPKEDEATAEAPKPRKPRTRRTKAEIEAEKAAKAAAPEDAVAEEKPKRTRRKKAEPQAEDIAEAPEKPKRTRRKKAEPTGETDEKGNADADA